MTGKIAIALLMAVCIFLFSGCNTVQGLGKDIQSGGKAIEKTGK